MPILIHFLWFCLSSSCNRLHPLHCLQPPPSYELEVMVIIFVLSDSWGLFTWNMLPGKIVWFGVPFRGRQSQTVRFKKSVSFTLKINNFFVLKDRYLIRFVNETWNWQNSIHHKNSNLRKLLTPITAPSKSSWSWRFFAFFVIIERDLKNFLLLQFFLLLFRGSLLIFH